MSTHGTEEPEPSPILSSYQAHVEFEQGMLAEGDHDGLQLPSCYTDQGSVDAWRHRRMYDMTLALSDSDAQATWLTVGDGRFGSDAYSLSQNGCQVTASSLTDASLQVANDMGFIGEFRAINAEKIDLPDNSVDYVLCKESYHHFPRPPIAFYEMLRVASKAVILIEPQRTRARPLDQLKTLIKKTIRGGETDLFEPTGNYIFRVNVEQIKDMMLALNLSVISHRYFNDFWHPKLSDGRAEPRGVKFALTKLGVAVQDTLGYCKLMDYGLVSTIAFKSAPSPETLQSLDDANYTTQILPVNPYRDTSSYPVDSMQ